MPFPITAKDAAGLIQQALRTFEDMYQERLGGAQIGDVFQIGGDDVFTLMISSGLKKENGYLQVSLSGTGGLQFAGVAGELSCKVKSGGGISVDADGLQASSENLYFFKTFTPTSGAPVVADQNSDTMTLTAGAGVSITGTAATDTIVIANTDGGAAEVSTHAAIITGVHGLVITAGQTITVEASSIVNQDLTSDASPTFATAKLTGLTDDYIPYHVSDAAGLANGPTKTNVDSAVSLKHTQGTDTALGAVGTKNPPIDADLAIYRDSAAANVLVTSTWTQVKAFLKTYFDGLYDVLGATSTHSALTTGVHGVGEGTVAEVADIAVDANLSAAAQAAVTASHARSHALDGISDHTIGGLTNTYIVKSDGTKLAPATNTDAQVSAAVTASHAAATVSAPISLVGQLIGLVNDAAAAITEVDTGALANSDTVIPTSKAVAIAIAAGGGGGSLFELDVNGDIMPL